MPRVVLVGGGHAHLPALKHARSLLRAGAKLTLVAPAPYHYYSGMGPGVLSGTYRAAQARIAVAELVHSRGGRFVQDRAIGIDPVARRLQLASGAGLDYDLISFNTGSHVPHADLVSPAENAGVIPVKPIENLLAARRRLLRRGTRPTRVLVVGAGPAGVELSGNLLRLARQHDLALSVTVVDAHATALAAMPPRAGRIAQAALLAQGADLVLGRSVARIADGCADLADGGTLRFDLAFLTLGITPHDLYNNSGLDTGPRGGLLVNSYLQAPQYPEIFGGGDCVCLAPHPLPRVGVYAIRQGPVLLNNLLASLRRQPLAPFRPQRRFLLILNLGDASGIVVWGNLVWRSPLAFRWKDHLDTSFMQRFQLCGELSE